MLNLLSTDRDRYRLLNPHSTTAEESDCARQSIESIQNLTPTSVIIMYSEAVAPGRDPQAPVPSQEVFGPTIKAERKGLVIPNISYGLPFDKAIVNHVGPDAKVYVLASKTLSEKTDSLDRLKAALGSCVKGVRVGMTPHTIFQECLEVTDEARKAGADTIVTLGAGSLSDAAKFVCKALTNDITTIAHLEEHMVDVKDGKWVGPQGHNPPTTNLIFIPTSLSAGEHTPFSGVTDGETKQKYQIMAAQAGVTIYDPWLAQTTPEQVWLQSGVRGIDHAVESVLSGHAFPEVYDACLKGLRLLVPGLLDSHGGRDSGQRRGPPQLPARGGPGDPAYRVGRACGCEPWHWTHDGPHGSWAWRDELHSSAGGVQI